MDKLVDYVKWMGAYPLSEIPFSDADALVLTSISYFELKDFQFEKDRQYRLSDFAKAFDEGRLVLHITGADTGFQDLMDAVLHSVRFGAIDLIEYADVLDPSVPLQFSAMDFQLDAQTEFLAFRGTDETIAGWQEDFMISFTETESQRRAFRFAEHVMLQSQSRFYFSGHSKGGNLALYAASCLSDDLKDRIEHIYLLDSPGFCQEVFPPAMYESLLPKCSLILPEFSVVGRIFELPVKDRRIVGSSQQGIMQHALESWQIDHGKLALLDTTDPQSDLIDSTLDRFLENTSLQDREPLVNDLFKALSADGAVTLNDIAGTGGNGFEGVLFRMFGASEATLETLKNVPLKTLLGEEAESFKNNGFVKWLTDSLFAHAVLLVLGGVLLIIFRNTILKVPVVILFAVLVVFQIIMTIRRLKEHQWDFRQARYSVYFCIALIDLHRLVMPVLDPEAECTVSVRKPSFRHRRADPGLSGHSAFSAPERLFKGSFTNRIHRADRHGALLYDLFRGVVHLCCAFHRDRAGGRRGSTDPLPSFGQQLPPENAGLKGFIRGLKSPVFLDTAALKTYNIPRIPECFGRAPGTILESYPQGKIFSLTKRVRYDNIAGVGAIRGSVGIGRRARLRIL